MAQPESNAFPDFMPIMNAHEVKPTTFLNLSDGQTYKLIESLNRGVAYMQRILLLKERN